jgi:pantothenate synthetase
VRAQKGLKRPTESETKLVVLGAATLGTTRLIDNLEVNVE